MNSTPFQTAGAAAQPNTGISKVIVAIHGIGDQKRNETIQTVTARFCDYCGFPAFTPLGSFPEKLGSGTAAYVLSEAPKDSPLRDMAFAEVYWASIPRKVVGDGYLLEEPKKWGRTLIERIRYTVQARGGNLRRFNFPMLHQVVPQIIETIHVLERIASLGKAAGLVEFNLGKILRDYLGDVQIVADFPHYRQEILAQFSSLMDQIHQHYPRAEIYLVAHSEGTVVSWLGLLQALSSHSPASWIHQVRGYMTIGSPIDKHLILWPGLFKEFRAAAPLKGPKIQWRNYYDNGDPVGFELDTARAWMEQCGFDQYFEFDGDKDDLGFSRYYLPGKAHNDYWTDPQVFGHFIADVVKVPGMPEICAKPPKTRRLAQVVSYVGGYLVPAVVLLIGLYAMYKPSGFFLHPVPEPTWMVVKNLLGLGSLLAGLTVLARIPRLVLSLKWQAIAIGIFLVGCGAYFLLVDEQTRTFLGYWPEKLHLDLGINRDVGVMVFAFVLAAVMFFVSKLVPKAGAKPIILPGVLGILLLAGAETFFGDSEPVKVWPLLLGGAVFFYLWWLAALLFDLVFVWHRYIRFSALDQVCEAAKIERAKPQRREKRG